MSKKIHGWGRYPVAEAELRPLDSASAEKASQLHIDQGIARGLGHSYGDSALSSSVIDTRPMNRLLSFDAETGELRCEAGISLEEILKVFLNRGWFLPVTPGTKHITVGGAIASDVHGKNHHSAGCFSDYVSSLKLLGPGGKIYHCSRQENAELYRATCGGMGLTGIILEATFTLQQLESAFWDVEIFKARDLADVFELFEEHQSWPYSVAWVDCLASEGNLGRSLLMVGRNRSDGRLGYSPSNNISMPFNLPSGLLNRYTVSLFNSLYYNRILGDHKSTTQGVESFFYPLDAVGNWNKIYGKNGFLQYQFVLPKEQSYSGLEKILQKISESGKGSFLSVLKLMGEQNDNYLSFPMKGYTLALDFKVEPGIFSLLGELDEIVADCGGRIYLTKDARMKPEIFEQGYPQLDKFREIRKRYGMEGVFESEQSKRLGI